MPPSASVWLLEKRWVRQLRRLAHHEVRLGEPMDEGPRATAELALLRALTLEREARWASLWHKREVLAAACRGVVEATLVGRYMLIPEARAPERLQRTGLVHLDKMTRDWLPPDSGTVAEIFGVDQDPGPRLPDYRQIAVAVDGAGLPGSDVASAVVLYDEYYAPLSNMSVHTGMFSLGRYYSLSRRRVSRRPWGVVPRRGLVRCCDAAIAALVTDLRTASGRDTAWTIRYGKRQLTTANRPVPVMMLRVALGMVRIIPTVLAIGWTLRRMIHSPDFQQLQRERQEAMVREQFQRLWPTMDWQSIATQLLDRFVPTTPVAPRARR